MKKFCVCNPLKDGKLLEYKSFIKEFYEKKDHENFFSYDITGILDVNIWKKEIEGTNYIIVYHEVSDDFTVKITNFLRSNLPGAIWFKEKLLRLYDTGDLNEEDSLIIHKFV